MSQSPGKTDMPSVEMTFGAVWNRKRTDLSNRFDPLAFHDDDAVANGLAAVAVDERAAD